MWKNRNKIINDLCFLGRELIILHNKISQTTQRLETLKAQFFTCIYIFYTKFIGKVLPNRQFHKNDKGFNGVD